MCLSFVGLGAVSFLWWQLLGAFLLFKIFLVFDSVRLRSVVVVELANFLPRTSVIVVLEVVTVDFIVFLPVVVSVVLVAVEAELM